MKFLILRFSSIGDIVLTTPVVRCLKKQYPQAVVHYCTKKSFESLVSDNPYIDKIHLLEDNLSSLTEELKAENFDCVIDLHHNLRTLFIKQKLRKPSFSFNKLNIEKFLLTNFKINILPRKHIVDRYLETLKKFNINNDGDGLDFFYSADAENVFQKLPPNFQNNYLVFCIGGGHFTKKLPTHKIISLINKISQPIILLGGKEDEENGNSILKCPTDKVFNGCGKFSLQESGAIIRQAKLVCTNDTGMMHVAAALKKPIVSFWGNTIPEFGMYPYYGENFLQKNPKIFVCMENKNLRCRPCSKIGYDKCPKKHFKCMEEISEEETLQQITDLMIW